MSAWSRRGFLAGAAAVAAAGRGAAEADIVAALGLAERTGFVVGDLDSGRVIEAHRADIAQPPGSVVKILTALYALDALGGDYRFETAVAATGPTAGGIVDGDLVLIGGGDPVLDTDALGDLVAALPQGGLRGVSGRLLTATGALPNLAEIEPGQPVAAGYNPAISGLNLNFNRVLVEWSAGPRFGFAAAGERFTVPLAGFTAAVGGGVPMRRTEAGIEAWRLPADTVTGTGSQWLPVVDPGRYAGAAFAGLAKQTGLAVPPPSPATAPTADRVLARAQSRSLGLMVQEMLHYSTNLTAEVVGLRASQTLGADPRTLAASAGLMSQHAAARYAIDVAAVNHSGLTDRSRITPKGLLAVLAAERGRLPGLLRERPILGPDRKPVARGGVRMVAKTGTLNFAAGLAGYLIAPDGRMLGFAILASDAAERARIAGTASENPPGAAAWETAARAHQHALLRRWAALLA